jgi:uncharacterized membrane protein YgdD (TMEM256/DUF423 family)
MNVGEPPQVPPEPSPARVVALTAKPMRVRWDASPVAVATAIEQAIREPRYEDAGHPEWSLWRVSGEVEGTSVDLQVVTYHEPGIQGAYPLAFTVRGTLVPSATGTELNAVATLPGHRLLLAAPAIGALLGGTIGLLLIGPVGALGLALFCGALLALSFIGSRWLAARTTFGALPQVEAVLERVGTPAGVPPGPQDASPSAGAARAPA